MATLSEEFKARAQRTGASPQKQKNAKTSSKHEQRPEVDEGSGHVEKKALYAREIAEPSSASTSGSGSDENEESGAVATPPRPSRKSTRKSSNRAKTDAPIEHAHHMQGTTAKARHDRAVAGSRANGTARR